MTGHEDMPMFRFDRDDAYAMVAYIRSMPPVNHGGAAVLELPLPVRVLYGYGAIKDSADKIDHTLPPTPAETQGVTREHGAYVANMCMGCHGHDFAGGRIPSGPPDWPPASNLTPGEGSAMVRYDTWEKLAAMLRSGKRPDGTEVNKAMPFVSLANLNDTDVRAIHAYFLTLPARKTGER